MAYGAKGRTKEFSVFDCDSHIYEPPEIWDKYIPQKIAISPRRISIAMRTGCSWCATGRSASEIPTSGNTPAKLGIRV